MQQDEVHMKGGMKVFKDAFFGIAVSSGIGIIVALALIVLVFGLSH